MSIAAVTTYPAVAHPERVSNGKRVFDAALVQPASSASRSTTSTAILDFAVFADDRRRLDIEIDGKRYHRNLHGDHLRSGQPHNWRLIEMG